jgi:glycosyltransferase involved in cell wall biosynthesis
VHDSQTGYIYRSGEIAELSSVMDHMIRNQELSRQMGQNAKRLIEERYSLNQATKGVYKAVSQIHG